ncbi:hypothetical protein ABH940_004013 [Streptacidiphilus sp. BW17]|uniref:DUF5959 family protein n=1 Tax=Streptacidiphilus sp. BW17 TaxID=3156274 RepID=UPI0035191FA0
MTHPAGSAPVDLVHLADADGHFIVRIAGEPSPLTRHDSVRAEALASASFVDARLDLWLFLGQLDEWEAGLCELVPGRAAQIDTGRGLGFTLHLHDNGWATVSLLDPERITLGLGFRVEDGWVEDHLDRLEQVRRFWAGT